MKGNGRRVIALVAGFGLDALLGDPAGWPHPVRLIGKQIERGESFLRAHFVGNSGKAGKAPGGRARDFGQAERMAGAALVAGVASTAPLVATCALKLVERAHPVAAVALESVLFYQLLAARSLHDAGMAVYDDLEAGDIEAARSSVGMIVGRDTDKLDEAGIVRATVETIAENASDGVVAPMLYMGMGGVPAALFYKAVNTLDSMVGYRNDRYRDFGWAAAKLDDLANIVPSRVTGALMCLAAKPAGFDAGGAWRVFKRDRHNHPSPNSAQAEAACAGALGVQLGGPSSYGGVIEEKLTIGDATRSLEAEDIPRASRLMYATAALSLVVAACAPLMKPCKPKGF